jgi:lantibiotic modifying enzyme
MTPAAVYLHHARLIGAEVAAAALWSGERCTWRHPPEPDRADVAEVVDGGFYEGTAGIGWFLAHVAALSTQTAPESESDLARAAVGAAWSTLDWISTEPIAQRSGFYDGAPGALWAVAEIGAVLGDRHLIEQALNRLPLPITPAATAPDWDVVSGIAGSLLAFAGLFKRHVTPEAGRSEPTAVIHLAQRLETTIRDTLAGGSGDDCLPTGLAHGASGAAWTLLDAARITCQPIGSATIEQIFRYERAWHDPQRNAWRDPLSRAPTGESWCHGLTGLTVARLRALSTIGEPWLLAQIGATIAGLHGATVRALAAEDPLPWELRNASVCHGMMGIVDALHLAGEVLGVPAHQAAARHLADRQIAAIERGANWPCGTLELEPSFGLMLGISGIGAVLLRLGAPWAIPPAVLPTYSTMSATDAVSSGSSR